jgi:hypothetical protein
MPEKAKLFIGLNENIFSGFAAGKGWKDIKSN